MELRFAKWEVGLAWAIGKIEREKTNEVRCRTANKERTRVSPRQMLALWQKERDKGRDSSRGKCLTSGPGKKGRSSEVCMYAGPGLRKGSSHRR